MNDELRKVYEQAVKNIEAGITDEHDPYADLRHLANDEQIEKIKDELAWCGECNLNNECNEQKLLLDEIERLKNLA